MVIDHIGIVVRSLESGIKQWRSAFGYQQITEIVENCKQKVKVVFLDKANSLTVKLIEPTDKDSPIFNFARRGGGLHHLCFKCESIDQEIDRLKCQEMRLITAPEPGEAFENESIAFMLGQNGLNVEFIETDKKAKRISSNK